MAWDWLALEPSQVLGAINGRMKQLADFLKKVPRFPVMPGEVGVTLPWYDYGDIRRHGASETRPASVNTTAIANAIASMSALGGGRVRIPATSTPILILPDVIQLSDSVALVGECSQMRGSLQTVSSTLKANTGASGTCLIGASDVNQRDMAVRHLRLIGNSTVTNGILWDRCHNSKIEDVSVDTFQGAGIYLKLSSSSATVGVLRDVWAQNCVQATGLSGRVGAVTVEWTDCSLVNVNATTSSTSVAESLNRVAILIAGANNFLTHCVGQISEDGIVVTGARNRLTNCRADLNYGNGFVVTSQQNTLSACLALSNSQGTTNTYDGFVVASLNKVVGCIADSSIATPKHRYGFLHTGSQHGNVFFACQSTSHATALYHTNTQVAFWKHEDLRVTMTADDTTPSVANGRLLATVANAGATAITQLDDGTIGQVVTIYCGSATNAPTIADGGNFQLSANWTPDAQDTITLVNVNGTTWAEVSRSAN